MNVVERVKKISLTPDAEWPVIASENTPPASVITGYVLPLVAIGAVAGFIGNTLVGQTVPVVGTFRVPFGTGLGMAVTTIVMSVLGVLLVAYIIDALAPTFGTSKSSAQAFKVAAYSPTPAWVAGVLQILPVLGVIALVAALYSIYLLYLGLMRVMKCPQEKAIGYTAVVVVTVLVVSLVASAITSRMWLVV